MRFIVCTKVSTVRTIRAVGSDVLAPRVACAKGIADTASLFHVLTSVVGYLARGEGKVLRAAAVGTHTNGIDLYLAHFIRSIRQANVNIFTSFERTAVFGGLNNSRKGRSGKHAIQAIPQDGNEQ